MCCRLNIAQPDAPFTLNCPALINSPLPEVMDTFTDEEPMINIKNREQIQREEPRKQAMAHKVKKNKHKI